MSRAVARAVAACLVLLHLTSGQVTFTGKCPKPQFQANFDVAQYFTGIWYEQKRFFAPYEVGLKCVTAAYKVLPTGYVQVNNSGITSKGNTTSFVGTAYCDKKQTAKCFVRFSQYQPWGSYNVLATDYKTFSVIYVCSGAGGKKSSQYGWILTRERRPSKSVIESSLKILTRHGVNISKLITQSQNC